MSSRSWRRDAAVIERARPQRKSLDARSRRAFRILALVDKRKAISGEIRRLVRELKELGVGRPAGRRRGRGR